MLIRYESTSSGRIGRVRRGAVAAVRRLGYTGSVHVSHRRPGPRPLAVYAATLALVLTATVLAVDRHPPLAEAAATLLVADRPRDPDLYLASDGGATVDHHVLYFGLDERAVAALRRADVLFLGNSRLMFGLRPLVVRPFFAAAGRSFYALGFGFREADRFPLAIIRRLDLRPSLVVVNADGFFGGGLSTWAELVHRDTLLAARKLRWEAEIAHEVRHRIHLVAPHWPSLLGRPGLANGQGLTMHRSASDGTWHFSIWPIGFTPFAPGSLVGDEAGRGEMAAAREFAEELERRGSRLLLTRVPTPQPMAGAGPARFSDLLGVPLVVSQPRLLVSHDNSHLDEASAHDWAREFVGALAPHVRATPDRSVR